MDSVSVRVKGWNMHSPNEWNKSNRDENGEWIEQIEWNGRDKSINKGNMMLIW